MNPTPRISDAEWEVMRVVWQGGPMSAQDVVEGVRHKAWSPRTVKTLLNRLVKKGALAFESRGRAYVYRAVLPQAQCMRAESRSFVERVFGGEHATMLLHFVRHARLSDDDIRELQRILEQRKK